MPATWEGHSSARERFESVLRLLNINVQWFRGGLVFKEHGRLYHSTLGLIVIKRRKRSTALSQGPAYHSLPPRAEDARARPWHCMPAARSTPASAQTGHLPAAAPAPPAVGSEGRRGRWGTPTMALHI